VEQTHQGSSETLALGAADGGPFAHLEAEAPAAPATTLGSLPTGSRLILRCRADWRAATVAAFEPELARVVLNVASPNGHTYRVRRPADSELTLDGPFHVLGARGAWRPCFARYDLRW
jgi:hypothetical protein